MSEHEVRIMTLEAMQVNSAYGFGEAQSCWPGILYSIGLKIKGSSFTSSVSLALSIRIPNQAARITVTNSGSRLVRRQNLLRELRSKNFQMVSRCRGLPPICRMSSYCAVRGSAATAAYTETSLLNEALEHGVGCDLDLVSRTLHTTPQGDIWAAHRPAIQQ
jgi:hypothetical protein